jgi:uroporphyrinogen decarboxylase
MAPRSGEIPEPRSDVMSRIERDPDYRRFVRVLLRKERPDRLPCYEHVASAGFISAATGVDIARLDPGSKEYWKTFVDFWLDLGFDCVPIEVPLDCPLPSGGHGKSKGSESHVVIRNRADFDSYPWPDVDRPLPIERYDIAAEQLPVGAKLVAGVAMGPYEWVSQMMGVVGLSLALVDDPELVEAMFGRIASLIESVDRQLAARDSVCALRQGDDLGFKTSTFLPPDSLRAHVLPVYRRIAAVAHEHDKPFVLHSCGNLAEIYDDLIDDCRIDGKHSFEDAIMPVGEFKRRYGARVTPLGGLDVDVICRADEATLRDYTRRHVDECYGDGFWALGTGNSLTDYMPVEQYRIVLDEGRRYSSRR